MSEFEALLEAWRAEPFDESALLLVDDLLLRLAAAWPSVPRRIVEPVRCRENVWSWIRYDHRAWELISGVRVISWKTVLVRLIGLKLIAPDGTIPTPVVDAIRIRTEVHLRQDRIPTPKVRRELADTAIPLWT